MASMTAAERLQRVRTARPAEIVEKVMTVVVLVGLAIWLLANLVKEPSLFFSVLLDGLNLGALYALIALGYTLVYGIIELINFAHGDLVMLGTLVSANVMVNNLHLTKPGLAGFFGLALVMVITMVFCGGINVAAEFFAYRRLRRAPKLAPLITAVGLSFIFQNIGQINNGSQQRVWPSVLGGNGLHVSGVKVRYSLFVVLVVTAVLLTLLTYIVQRTRRGKAMRAVAQDQDGARLMGINVDATISFTFLLGGLMAGAAAVLLVQTEGVTRYDAGFELGLIAFTAAVLGGIGNLVGAVVGGLLIGIIQGLNDGATYGLGQAWSQSVVFGILILVLVFRPRGLFGSRAMEKV